MSDNITDKDVDEFLEETRVMIAGYQFWKTMIDDFAFQGFNPRNFIRDVLLPIVGGNRSDLLMYLQAAAVWVETRGTKVARSKVISKTNDKGKDIIRRMETLFSISDRPPTDNVTVTMGRLEACVPHIAAQVRAQFPRDVRNLGDLNGLEPYLAFPGGAALIPSTDQKHFDKWFEWNKKFDKLIKPAGQEATKEDRLMTYALAVWRSPILDDKQRKETLKGLKTVFATHEENKVERDDENDEYQDLKKKLSGTKAAEKTYEGTGGPSTSGSTSGSKKTTAGRSLTAAAAAAKEAKEAKKKAAGDKKEKETL